MGTCGWNLNFRIRIKSYIVRNSKCMVTSKSHELII